MGTRREESELLQAAVAAERLLPADHRPTHASDRDLDAVDRLLDAASGAEMPTERQALRGRITRIVVDTWSFDTRLSDELVKFDDRFLVP